MSAHDKAIEAAIRAFYPELVLESPSPLIRDAGPTFRHAVAAFLRAFPVPDKITNLEERQQIILATLIVADELDGGGT